jgi:3-oxoacyl-[acyl-carrier protein] reductase
MVDTAVEKFGSIDILVNNAGITKDTFLIKMTEEDWDNVLDINLKGSFLCTKAVSKVMMKQRSGKIINVASVVGIMGNAGQANYSAAKAGIIGFTKSLAKELAPRNITVNAIAPGFIETDMTKGLDTEKIVANIPLGRLGKPEDIAQTVKFFATVGSYITGQVIGVDGGLVI